jgi:hypothetical protein
MLNLIFSSYLSVFIIYSDLQICGISKAFMNNSVKNSNHTFLNLAVSYSFVTKTKYVTFLSISDAMFLNVLDQIHKSTTYLCFKYSFA